MSAESTSTPGTGQRRAPEGLPEDPATDLSVSDDADEAPTQGQLKIRLVIAANYLAALACVVGAAWTVSSRPLPDLWRVLLAAAVMFVGESPLLSRRVNSERELITLGEAGFVVALAVCPAAWLVLVALPVLFLRYSLRHFPPVKALFNASSATVGVVVGGTLAHLADGTLTHPSGRMYLGLAAAGAAYGLWTAIPVTGVLNAITGTPWRTLVLRELGFERVKTVLGNTVVGVSVLGLAHWSPITLLVLPPVLVGLYHSYQANLNSQEQRNDWRQLNAAAKELANLDEEAVFRRVKARARELFGASDVSLQLDQVSEEDLAALSTAAPLTIPHQGPRLRKNTRTVERAAVALPGGRGEFTVMFPGPTSWTDHEDQVLAALAHTVSSAVIRNRLYEQARRRAEEKAHEATHDALTGLGNRRLLLESANQLLASGADAYFGLLLIDLDKFKEVNDTLGHSAGDRLLRGVAHRLRDSVRTGDVVTRLGGDEFAVLVTGIDHAAQAESVAAELAEVLARPVEVDGFKLAVEGSVGVAIYPDDGQTAEELLSRADVAMYKAKGSHPRWQRYQESRDDSTLDRLALVAELRPAIDERQLVLYYQPQIELRSGRITGVEALVRWNHPVRGLLTPETFVPAVEQSGFVQEFTRAILRSALEACAGWRESGFDVGVSVNLSARNLLNTDLPGEVAQLLLTYKVPAPALTLEITETAMMSDPDTAKQLLASLSEIGVRIAVDDFGTGYSSLTLLQRCVLHEVKVDRGFVQRLLLERSDAAIVAATVQLAHSLGLTVVAEGIESQELLEALAALHCDFGQGLYIGGAMPLDALTEWFTKEANTARTERGPDARILPLHPRRPATG
jgi:diguanylate cyclase (GGDEF)-like protein